MQHLAEGEEEALMTQLDRQAMLPVNYSRTSPVLQPVIQPQAMSENKMLGLLQQVFDRLERPEAEDMSSDEHLLSYLHSIMLDPARFVAGNLKASCSLAKAVPALWVY